MESTRNILNERRAQTKLIARLKGPHNGFMTIELGAVVANQTVTVQVRPRVPTQRRYLLCPPKYFTVKYSINPWMDPSKPVSTDLAVEQWTRLKQAYQGLGHTVEVIEPQPGLQPALLIEPHHHRRLVVQRPGAGVLHERIEWCVRRQRLRDDLIVIALEREVEREHDFQRIEVQGGQVQMVRRQVEHTFVLPVRVV